MKFKTGCVAVQRSLRWTLTEYSIKNKEGFAMLQQSLLFVYIVDCQQLNNYPHISLVRVGGLFFENSSSFEGGAFVKFAYFTYSEKSVRCMSPLRASESCMAKAAVRLWRVCPILANLRYSRSSGR